MNGGADAGGVGRVDAHHHVWDLDVRDQPWITGTAMAPLRRTFPLAELAPQARRAGVTASVAVQTVPDERETAELLLLADDAESTAPASDSDATTTDTATDTADRLAAAVVGWSDLTAPDLPARIAALRARPGGHRLAGLRHQAQDEPDPRWLCRADVREGLRAVADAGLVYELLVTPEQLPAAVETAEALPQCRFVLDHMGKPPIAAGRFASWARGIGRLAALPYVECKLSGLVTEADWASWTVEGLRPYARLALEAFGPGRVLFGSDWPVCTLAAGYAETVAACEALTAGLTEPERAAVFGGNARRVYSAAFGGVPGAGPGGTSRI